MKVLVAGGAGYVGGAVTDLLMEGAHEIRVFDSLLYEESYRKPVDFVCGDIRDRDLLLKHLKWADAVIWLAALVGDGACQINPRLSIELNQSSVEWLASHFDGRIVFTSTCSVYGSQEGELAEDSPLNPLSVYAATKLAAEKALEGRNAAVFRLGTLFGIGDLFSRIRLDLVLNYLTVLAAVDGDVTVFGGEQYRPLLHVKDAARACAQAIDSGYSGIFNLHTENVRIIDFARQLRKHFPEARVTLTEMHVQDARNYRVTSDKARQNLNWIPLLSIDDGIREMKELICSKRLKDFKHPRYHNQNFLTKVCSDFMVG